MSRHHSQYFSLSREDFEAESVLKRRRQLSPPQSPVASRTSNRAASSATADRSSIVFRTRSKSKSRAPEQTLRRLPSVQGQEFIALGRSDRSRGAAASSRLINSTGSTRSPSRGRVTSHNSHSHDERQPEAKRARSSSKARATQMELERKPSRREDRGRSKSTSRKRPHSRRSSRSSSSDASHGHSHSHSRSRSRSNSRSRSSSRKHTKTIGGSSRSSSKRHKRSKSKSPSPPLPLRSISKPKASASTIKKAKETSTPSVDSELQRDIDRNETKLKQAKRDLSELELELATLQTRVDAKKYEMMDLQIVLDGLQKRRELQQQFLRRDSFTATSAATPAATTAASTTLGNASTTAAISSSSKSRHKTSPERKQLSTRSSRPSKRPVIEDEEDDETESDDDIVEIIERADLQVKEEVRARPQSSSRRSTTATTSSSSSKRGDRVASSSSTSATNATNAPPAVAPPVTPVAPMSDYFWGRVDVAKLLVQPRILNVPDGSTRKGRHLEFNPVQHDTFATSSDDGGMIIWRYAHQTQQLAKFVSFDPLSFRKDNQCAESIAWSPEGQRLAIAFRDPLASMGEFCVVRLHELSVNDTNEPQMLPRKHVHSKSTTLHSRGISSIAWVPGGFGDQQGTRGIVTAGSDHNLVLWEEHKNRSDYKWRILHHEHRSDVRSICMHSQGNMIYTGGLDGLVIRYDMNAQRAHTVIERRRPHISKINSVLENPHNPNLLLVSSVEQSEHNLVLHDLRERFSDKAMTLSWMRSSDAKSMSQYIVPRWSPGGFHVSCGSTSGLVNIWDVRVRGPKFPSVLPQQSIQVHQKQVLHATWSPRHDAMFSVSNDRTIGLLGFR